MITRISEIIHKWMGWCPNAHMTKAKSGGDAGLTFRNGNPLAKSPGPSGADGSGKPREGLYDHTQRGSLIIGAVTAAIFVILATTYLFGIVWVAVFVLGIMVVVLAICSTLTVSVTDDTLRLRFGPVGLIKKSWPMAEIASVTTVINPWYYGWGIRWTPHGRLYNVSGYGAVEVRLVSGKTFRIGTDEPEALKLAIEHAQYGGTDPGRSTG
ncbi:MAG: DUF1673 family protein [Methanoregula sp.]|nr:DUF1673 family protein [Methanoregula sp.]